MGLLMPAARLLLKTSFVQQAVEEQADLKAFRDRPPAKLVIGVVLIGLSMLMGWPAVGAFGLAAAYLKKPLVLLLGGGSTYGASWLVWGVGMLIAGPDNVKYAKLLLRWAVKSWAEKAMGQAPAPHRAQIKVSVAHSGKNSGESQKPDYSSNDRL